MKRTAWMVAGRSTAALWVLLLSACISTDSHRLEEAAVAGSYGLGDSDKNAPVSRVALGERVSHDGTQDTWWTAFGDERLNRLVAQMLALNSDLVSAGFRLQRARLNAGLATHDLFPRLDAAAATDYARQLSADSPGTRGYGANASLDYEVDLWGRLRTQRNIAVWEAQATEEDRQSTFLALIGDTCDLYWTLAFLNQRIVAAEESLARVERTFTLVRAQYDSGAVSRVEVREAEQNLQSQRAAQSALIQQRVETRNALTVLMDGHPWPQPDEPRSLNDARSPELQAGLPAELLGRRPDLRAAEFRLRQVLAQIKVVRSAYYPAISLTGSVGGSSTSLSDVLANPIATLGAGLALPFLHWSEAGLNTRIASAEFAIATNDFRRTLYTAFAEVDSALSAKTELTRQLKASQQSYEAALEVERLYEIRYRAGATSLRTWLDAQEIRRSAEISLAQARLSQLQNDSFLFQALGGSGG